AERATGPAPRYSRRRAGTRSSRLDLHAGEWLPTRARRRGALAAAGEKAQMRIRSRTLAIAIAGSILAALAGGGTATAAEVGAAGVSVGVAPNTDPDVAAILDC